MDTVLCIVAVGAWLGILILGTSMFDFFWENDTTERKTTPTVQKKIQKIESSFVGNNQTLKLHVPNCKWAEAMTPANRTHFESLQDALDQNYETCKTCKPEK